MYVRSKELNTDRLSLTHGRIVIPAQHHYRVPGFRERTPRYAADTMGRPGDDSDGAHQSKPPTSLTP